MLHSVSSKKIVFSALSLSIVCLSLVACKKHSYDWNVSAQEYVDGFNCEFVLLESYEDSSSDSVIYKYQTDDDLQIVFSVNCFWGDTLLPFGFKIPVKKAKIDDDFAEQICAYVSETDGIYDIEDKTVEDISTYVLDTLRFCETLFQQYGIENATPSVSFTLIGSDNSYDFKYGNTNEILLIDKLTELLYE